MGYVDFMFSLYFFVVGSCFGSFFNVISERKKTEESFLKGRSHCPVCGEPLKIFDIIPVISYILLRGKCRFCKTHIPIRYLWAEILGGVSCVMVYMAYGPSWRSVYVCSIGLVLVLITLIDFSTMEIPDSLIIVIGAFALVGLAFKDIPLWSRAIGFFIISLPMFGIILAIPDAFGGGDIKLIAVCGFILGFDKTLLAMFIALITGGIYAVLLLVTGRAQKKEHMAFGPYICLGVFLSMIYGTFIIDSYLSIFGLL